MRWIKVSERLPEECVNVLLWYGDSTEIGSIGGHGHEWFDSNGFFNDSGELPSHWMPIPKPPEE